MRRSSEHLGRDQNQNPNSGISNQEPTAQNGGNSPRKSGSLEIGIVPLPNASSISSTEVKAKSGKEQSDFHPHLFAERSKLAWWFPQINSDESNSWRLWLSKRSRALLVHTSIVGVILITNTALTVYAIVQYGSEKGVGRVYSGNCDTVKRLDTWLHLLINLLGTGMLSASNYCMQLQAAPTRKNVDKAHSLGKYLDIGVPSLRNFSYISLWRQLSWLLLAFSSVPIHLIYNSAIFASLSSNDYTIAVVNNAFLSNDTWNLTKAEYRRSGDPAWDESRVNPVYLDYQEIITSMQQNASAGLYQEQNISTCFETYDDYWTPQSNAVVLVKNQSVQTQTNDSLLIYVSIIPRSDDWAKNMWALGNGTRQFTAISPSDTVTKWFLGTPYYEVDRCLVQNAPAGAVRCQLEYSPQIMVAVCLLNLVKAVVMFTIWLLRRQYKTHQESRSGEDRERQRKEDAEKEVLYTLGDAISSFVRSPDPTTKNMCLATKYDFMGKRSWKRPLLREAPNPSQEAREWKEVKTSWMAAASVRRWITLIVLCVLVLVVAAILLGISLTILHHRHLAPTIPDLWGLGFGALTPYTYIVLPGFPRDDPAGLIANVLIANLPQLLLSILYIFYNGMLSCFLVQREFSRMYRERKPLRVSEPTGIQRSSYFISLPLKYGIPLYVSSGIMHWLISQSLFLARITALTAEGDVDTKNSFSTCGYSPIAIFITILVGAALVLAIILIGFRKYDGTMPLVATNSKAISAMCHVLEEDRPDGYLLPVQWGVVEVKDGVGKCTFTTAPIHEIKMPVVGMKYK